MNFRPLYDRIVIKRSVDSNDKTPGGIVIPDAVREKPANGTVLAIGNGKILDSGKTRPIQVKVGDTVLFSKYSGIEIELDGDKHLIMKEDELIGVVE